LELTPVGGHDVSQVAQQALSITVIEFLSDVGGHDVSQVAQQVKTSKSLPARAVMLVGMMYHKLLSRRRLT